MGHAFGLKHTQTNYYRINDEDKPSWTNSIAEECEHLKRIATDPNFNAIPIDIDGDGYTVFGLMIAVLVDEGIAWFENLEAGFLVQNRMLQ